jgi:hypothetical protein
MRSWFTALALHAVALSCVAVRAVPSPTPPTPPTPSSLRGVSFGEDVGEVGLKEVMFIETGAGAKLYGHRVLSSHHAGSAKCHKLAKKDDACRNDGRPSGVVKDGCTTCHCPSAGRGYSGDRCEILDHCTHGKDNIKCDDKHGKPVGTLIAKNCKCRCEFGWMGQACSDKEACSRGPQGRKCENGGTGVGLIPDGCSRCKCPTDKSGTPLFSGDWCEETYTAAMTRFKLSDVKWKAVRSRRRERRGGGCD